MTTWLRMTGAVLGAAALAACADAGSGTRPESESPDVAAVQFRLQQTGQLTTQAAATWVAAVAGVADAAVHISPDTVASLIIRVTDIQVLPVDTNGTEPAWVSFAVSDTVEIDLMALPTQGQSPIVIAAGTLPIGDYQNVRLFVDSAAIEFTGPITIGAAFTYDASVPYAVTIPSGAQSGLKTDAAFSVADDGQGNPTEVTLLFSPGSTFQNVAVTGNGRVMLAPVIRGNPPQGS